MSLLLLRPRCFLSSFWFPKEENSFKKMKLEKKFESRPYVLTDKSSDDYFRDYFPFTSSLFCILSRCFSYIICTYDI